MATKKKPKPRPMSQSALETLVKFQPQFDALTQLANQARGEASGSIKAANTVAQAVQAAVEGQRAPLAKVYDTSLDRVKAADTVVGRDLSALGPAADIFKGAQISETGVAAGNIAEARAAALQGLTDRITQARAGQQGAVIAARGKLAEDLSKIASQRMSLAGQAGAFESASARQLYEKSLDRANSRVIAGVNPDGSIIPGGKADKPKAVTLPGGQKIASGEAHRAAQSVINSYASRVARLVRFGMKPGETPLTRQQIAALLSEGREGGKAQPIFDPKTGKKVLNPDGTQATTKAGKGFEAVPEEYQAFIPAILDLVYDGHISDNTARLLHGARLSVRQLGYPGRGTARSPFMVDVKRWRKRQEAERRRRAAVAKRAGAAFGLPPFAGG